MRWLLALVLIGGLFALETPQVAPLHEDGGVNFPLIYNGPYVKVLQTDTLIVCMVSTRDYQANGTTPIRLWTVPDVNGIFACLFGRSSVNPGDLLWNFFDFNTFSWVAGDTGYHAYESAGYGNMSINFYSNQYQYYPFFTGHEYVTGNYNPDAWWPESLTFNPFSWNGNWVSLAGEAGYYIWPRIGFTQSGFLHQITSDHSEEVDQIYYNRMMDPTNPYWDGLIQIVETEDGPWYGFYSDPFSRTIVVTYCRTEEDYHIVMLIDTLEGDMFYGGTYIQVDVSDLLSLIDPISIGWVGDGTPFVDRDGNIHHVIFGSDGERIVPCHIWHFFYNPREDTFNFSLIDTTDTTVYYFHGINTLGAGRAQIGQNRENGALYVIWEQFIEDSARFVVSSTDDTLPPVAIRMARSFDNGVTWDSVWTLVESDVDFGNHWLRFPLLSPIITYADGHDRVVWGVHEDYDPGFNWQGQGVDTTQVLWVGILDVPTGVEESEVTKPSRITLASTPNPAKYFVSITYELPKESEISLKVFDLSGRLIKTLDEGVKKPGSYTVEWNLRDESGSRVSAGVYFYVLKTEGKEFTRKLVITH